MLADLLPVLVEFARKEPGVVAVAVTYVLALFLAWLF